MTNTLSVILNSNFITADVLSCKKNNNTEGSLLSFAIYFFIAEILLCKS